MSTIARSKPLTDGQKRALAAMPELRDSKFQAMRAEIPASNYVDPARFDLEKAWVYRKVPVIAAPAALLPRAGMYMQQDLVGMPVLVTRDRDGAVHAFVNVCTHRGAKLCPHPGAQEKNRIICPYHAWTFGLDGALAGVPRQETFPGLDKSALGLTPLPCLEAGGLIWVGTDPENVCDFGIVKGELEDDLDALGLGGMHVFRHVTFAIKANWKLVMDTMLDSYHVTRLHKDSLARFFVDAENIIDQIGLHVRAAAARGNFEKAKICDEFEQARQIMVFAYTIFPNGIVVVSPEFVSVAVLRPISTDRTDVDYYMLVNAPPADEKTASRHERSFVLMEQAFGREDYWAAELCDTGLRAGTMKEVHLGGMEVQIQLFHNAVNRCLAAASRTGK